jgi:hypothetical protein
MEILMNKNDYTDAYVNIKVPYFQIGQKVHLYFPDTMTKEGIVCEQPSLKQIKQELLDIILEDLDDIPRDEFTEGEEFGLREAIQIIDKYINWTK